MSKSSILPVRVANEKMDIIQQYADKNGISRNQAANIFLEKGQERLENIKKIPESPQLPSVQFPENTGLPSPEKPRTTDDALIKAIGSIKTTEQWLWAMAIGTGIWLLVKK